MKREGSKNEATGSGRADVRYRESTNKFRIRVYALAPDQIEVILPAFAKARAEIGTQFDSVALTAICMNYLAGGNVTKK